MQSSQQPETKIDYIPPDELHHVIVVQSKNLCDIHLNNQMNKAISEIHQKAEEQQEKKTLSALFTPEEKASLKATHDQGRALGKAPRN